MSEISGRRRDLEMLKAQLQSDRWERHELFIERRK
jgi:hypothetical protein